MFFIIEVQMRVIFKKLIIQNLLSFGNSEVTIDFTKGLNLITGKNGSGKSSALLDAISFALYDKPYRKINKTELINRKNKKNLKVSCEFEVNGTPYKIVRGLKHSDVDLEFYIDNVKQDILSAKSLSQEQIEKYIGVDYKLFKQVISLSINHNEPFLTLPSQDKRELLEKFFNIDVIASMLKKAKDEQKNIKIKKDMVSHSVDMLADVLRSDKKNIQEWEESKNNFDSDKHTELLDIKNKIHINKGNLKKLKSDGLIKKTELDALEKIDITVLQNEKESISKNKNSAEIDIRNAEKILKALNEYDVCPTCQTKLTEEHKNLEVNIQEKIISDAKSNITIYDDELLAIKSKIVDAQKNQNIEQEIKYAMKDLKTQYMNIESQIEKLTADKDKVTNRQFMINIQTKKEEYSNKLKEYKSNKDELGALQSKLSMYDKIIDILSDKGIKSYIFEQLIPVLNKSINHYLNIFELPVYIEFDNTMKDSIKTTTNFNSIVKYASFSEGEKKKIDMAILFSFIDVTKKIANWNCNLLVIDELLDSSIDDNGLEKLLESLERMSAEDSEMGIYIISHRFKSEYKHFFSSMVEVSKNKDGFSKIVEI